MENDDTQSNSDASSVDAEISDVEYSDTELLVDNDNDNEISDVDASEDEDDNTSADDEVRPLPATNMPISSAPVKKKRGRPKRTASSDPKNTVPPVEVVDYIDYKPENENMEASSEDDSDEENTSFQKLADSKYAAKVSRVFSVPESLTKEELTVRTFIQRDKNGNICDPMHQTIPFLTMYERTRVLSERVGQLDAGAEPLVPVPPELRYNNYEISIQELVHKKLPFIIQRPLPDNTCEYWKLVDLQLI